MVRVTTGSLAGSDVNQLEQIQCDTCSSRSAEEEGHQHREKTLKPSQKERGKGTGAHGTRSVTLDALGP